jgi:hypothetical protein
MKKIIITEEERQRILGLHQFKKMLIEASQHSENLYKSWANKKSGNPELALSLMNDFFDLQKQLPKKDFLQYNTAEELKVDIDKLKNIGKKPEDAVEVIYKDDGLLVVATKTWQAGCKYGAGTKWCTSAKDDSSYWKRHNNTGTEFIWINKNIPADNPNYKLSLHIRDNNTHDWCNAINRCGSTSPYKTNDIEIPNFNEIFNKCMDFHKERLKIKNEKRQDEFGDISSNPSYIQITNELNDIINSIITDDDILHNVDEIIMSHFYEMLDETIVDLSDDEWIKVSNDVYDFIRNETDIYQHIEEPLLLHMREFIMDDIDINTNEAVWRDELTHQIAEMFEEYIVDACLVMLQQKYIFSTLY